MKFEGLSYSRKLTFKNKCHIIHLTLLLTKQRSKAKIKKFDWWKFLSLRILMWLIFQKIATANSQ